MKRLLTPANNCIRSCQIAYSKTNRRLIGVRSAPNFLLLITTDDNQNTKVIATNISEWNRKHFKII